MTRKSNPTDRLLSLLLLFLSAATSLLAYWRLANREPWSIHIESPKENDTDVYFLEPMSPTDLLPEITHTPQTVPQNPSQPQTHSLQTIPNSNQSDNYSVD
ncbi:MAG: hypothetical protein N2035_01880 [Chthoniobacterales bacterium]|nr:hypothetical protein [Chthoniobacterales bacterium]MCX7712407.1 hypothetical protein [Chthoniobacterales bacterium]